MYRQSSLKGRMHASAFERALPIDAIYARVDDPPRHMRREGALADTTQFGNG
jgi:hypothetical protein